MSIADKWKQVSLLTNPVAFCAVGAHTQNTTLNTVQSISVPSGANGLLVQATVKDIRYTIDGSTPSASVGFLLPAYSDPVILVGVQDNTTFKFIEVAASATLDYVAIRLGGE